MLDVVPTTLAEANAFVERYHRHHQPTVGHKYSVACADTERGEVVGVAIVGRPVARYPWVWVIEFERCERPKGWPEGIVWTTDGIRTKSYGIGW